MRLDAPWLGHAGTVALLSALGQGGHGAWFVGGCVRNAIIGAPVADIDIATDAPPDRVVELAEAAGLKTVPTGIAHGTITVVAEGKPLEVTTLRRDVATDGRHAVVAFTDRLEEDASRRDFTMNALYAQADGIVLDPTGAGLSDLAARRVRFIGAPEDRITEDYLRILRFFRFHAWYGLADSGLDPDGLAACAANGDGLEQLSRERIGAEMRKLLCAPDPAPSVAAMDRAGLLARVLPGADSRLLVVLVHLEAEAGIKPAPMRRLVALGGEDAPERLRLSRAEAREMDVLRHSVGEAAGMPELGYRLGEIAACDVALLRAAAVGRPVAEADLIAIARGAAAQFPVRAEDLMPEITGPALGQRLAELEARWIASDFTASRADLLR